MAWRVAKAILTLHTQLRPLAPNAPRSSFGTVGDLSHQTGTSDHNPRLIAGLGSTPTVTAGDFPKAGRLDPHAVLEAIRRSRDVRVKYAISRGRMFSSYAAHGYPPWTWRPYSGKDGHYDHGHLSVVGDSRADQTHPWAITSTQPTPTSSGGGMADQETINLHRWTHEVYQGLQQPSPGTPHAATFGQGYWPNVKLTQIAAGVAALLSRDPAAISDAQVELLADRIGDRLIDAQDNPLGADDKPTIVEAVKQALREGTAT